jgi:8-oxo-dGTP diphosphatase
MQSKGLVVKAIVLKDNKFLVLIKPNGIVDLPGGHAEVGEGVSEGLLREISEETGLVVGKPAPINQWILLTGKGNALTGMTFCCDYKKGRVVLSNEHTDFFWQDLGKIKKFTPQIWVQEFFLKK